MRCSAKQFDEFLESHIWLDMQEELEAWLEGVRDGLEDPGLGNDEMLRNQGRANAIRYALSLPGVLRDSLIDEQQSQSVSNKTKEED